MANVCWLLLLATGLAGFVASEDGHGSIADLSSPYGPIGVEITGAQVVTVGIPYGFVCSAKCSPTCTYTWTDDGQSVQGQTLDLLLPSLVKTKVLLCEARNTVTGVSETVSRTLLVTEGPLNVKMSRPGWLSVGVSSRFVCSANCSPSCNYTWFIDGQQGAQGPEDHISAESWMKQLTIACQAKNTVSGLLAYVTETLWVAFGPSSALISGPDTVAVGVPHQFVCLAYCIPSCNYTWTPDEETTTTNILHITVKSLASPERITCTVQNTLSGQSFTATKALQVTDPISVSPVSVAPAIANRPYSLKCVGTKGQASVRWTMNLNPLIINSRVILSDHNTTVTFNPVLQSDGGLYYCISTEGTVVIQSVSYEVYVNYGPVQAGIIQPGIGPVGKYFYMNLGSQAMLWCSADCYPSCSYTWTLDGKVVGKESSVSFIPVISADAGNLTCVANNAVTDISTSAVTILALPDGPYNLSISGPKVVDVGVKASFKCSAKCSPPCAYTWTAYGKSIPGGDIQLTPSRLVDSEVLTCEARNIVSGRSASANETLHVIDQHPCGC